MTDATLRCFHRHPTHSPARVSGRGPIIQHITFGVYPRRDLLATPEIHAALTAAWRRTTAWVVGYYMIMPDHIHLFCAPGFPAGFTVRRWGGRWKRSAGQEVAGLRGAFETDCWDTQMRSAEHYHRKIEYVQQNPVRRGLVTNWQDWPFQGTVSSLIWLA